MHLYKYLCQEKIGRYAQLLYSVDNVHWNIRHSDVCKMRRKNQIYAADLTVYVHACKSTTSVFYLCV